MLALLSPISSQATVTRVSGDTCAVLPPICQGIHPLILPLSEPIVDTAFEFYVASRCDDTFPGLPHYLLMSHSNQRYNGIQLPASLARLGIGNMRCFLYVGNGVLLASPMDKVWRFGITEHMIGQTFYFQAFMIIPDQLHGDISDGSIVTTDLLTAKVMSR